MAYKEFIAAAGYYCKSVCRPYGIAFEFPLTVTCIESGFGRGPGDRNHADAERRGVDGSARARLTAVVALALALVVGVRRPLTGLSSVPPCDGP